MPPINWELELRGRETTIIILAMAPTYPQCCSARGISTEGDKLERGRVKEREGCIVAREGREVYMYITVGPGK